jgi:predicted AAA+ superfamily ATPase
VLYSVADSDIVSLNTLSKNLGIPRPTLTRIFAALKQAEVLYKLEPQGSHMSQLRRSDKYLFTTPAIRAMYFTLTGSIRASQQVIGHLLEDAVGLYLRRIFGERSLTNSITYGSTQGSADFIVRNRQSVFVIETGLGEKPQTNRTNGSCTRQSHRHSDSKR